MTGSPDLREHFDSCACDGIRQAVLQLAALKNLPIRESDCAQIAAVVAFNLGPDGRRRFVEAPTLELQREIAWGINNCLDWMAAHDLVLGYILRHGMQMPDEALGLAVDNVVRTLKGANPVDGPTWRWPDSNHMGRAVGERGDSAWPLDPRALGASIIEHHGARA